MSSLPRSFPGASVPPTMDLAQMQVEDLDAVLAIEQSLYPHPWSRGNFLDSLYSGYETWILRDTSGSVSGYFLAMAAVDEMHLLNISVRGDLHGQGYGRVLLNKIIGLALAREMRSILLEVRPSNAQALAVYERCGFHPIGRRKGYYPAAENTREDAIVMRLPI